MEERERLSARSALVLRLISEGRTYEQILSLRPEMTYLHIFAAAREALEALDTPTGGGVPRPEARIGVEEARGAYGAWSAAEDAELVQLVAGGESVEEMAARLRRHPDAVRARMMMLNLSKD